MKMPPTKDATQTSEPNDMNVGCEGDDGLLRIHPESETCDVCGSGAAPVDALAEECKRLADALSDSARRDGIEFIASGIEWSGDTAKLEDELHAAIDRLAARATGDTSSAPRITGDARALALAHEALVEAAECLRTDYPGCEDEWLHPVGIIVDHCETAIEAIEDLKGDVAQAPSHATATQTDS